MESLSKIVIITNADSYYATAKKALKRLQEESLLQNEAEIYLAGENSIWDGFWEHICSKAKMVYVEWMGITLEIPYLQGALEYLKKRDIPYKLKAGEEAAGNASRGFEPADHAKLARYGVFGGVSNFKNMWLWLLNRFDGADFEIEEPQEMLWNGIYHPRAKKIYTDLQEYQKDFCNPEYPYIGLSFYRNEWLADTLEYQKAFIEECERQHINCIAVLSHGVKNPEMGAPGLEVAFKNYFYQDGRPIIDALVNTIKFSFTASGSLEIEALKELNVPLLHAYTMMRPIEEWEENIQGLSAVEVSISVTMPEFDGAIHGVPIAGKYRDRDNIIFYVPMPERIERLVRKAKKWSLLRHKANKDKKVAIVFHNYPPTNSNIGSALGMDSPESIRRLLALLQTEDYGVEWIPQDSKTFMEELIACATNDRRFMTDEQIENAIGRVDLKTYKRLFDRLPQVVQQRMIEAWGEPLGNVFNYDNTLLIPGMLNGNIIITVQPPRGFGEDNGKIYHDPVAPPTHHYLAFYYWLKEIWQADVVMHIGTHGSVEWLPGKATGLSEGCYPDICLDDMPNLYYYIVTVIGEGIQAKRRSAACLIDYLTPPMSTSGLYDALAELEALIDEYLDFKDKEIDKLDSVCQLIRQKVAACNLDKELPENEGFDSYVGKLHNYLTDLKNLQIRVGLHTLAEPPKEEELVEYLFALTRLENGKIPSLSKTLAESYGYDYYDLLENSAKRAPKVGMSYGRLADKIREQSLEINRYLMEQSFEEKVVEKVLELQNYSAWPVELQEKLLVTCRYVCNNLAPNLEATVDEFKNTLRGLCAEFIEPSVAGAPTNGRADVLPTGRNFYGVDPRTLPTKAAWQVGRDRADGVINAYIRDEGCYPETIGMAMFSDMRTHGANFATFLYLLGVRPIWQAGSGRVLGVEAIPLEELKRPRIDCTARITGMMRDSMPCVVSLLDQAVRFAAELEESEEVNFIKKHVREDREYLEAQGLDTMEAAKQATYRIFGCPPGGYGAGVSYLLNEKNWEKLEDLSEVYVRWGAHVYGENETGAYKPQVFKRRLSRIDATVMGVDNREIHMFSSDDFNSYHGGLIAGVRTYSGKMPRTYCADSTDTQHVVVRTMEQEAKRIFRGEITNPKYIKGMMEHGYKGAADMGNNVAHCYQWDATSELMDDWMYEDLAAKYALDPEVRKWMQEVNPWALHRITETLLEAEQRQMWQAKPETKEQLQELMLDMEGEMEERADS